MKIGLFLASCLLSFLAGHMVNYSIVFLSLEWFNSHSIAGIGYALCFGPPIILGWFAGVYCDRYSPRNVILIAQNSYFVSVALLLFAFGLEQQGKLTLLLIAAFFSGVGWSFVAPARFAAVNYYVSKDKLMMASIGLNLMIMTGFGLAPMLLKTVKVSFEWQGVFLLTAILLALSSLLLIPLRTKFSPKALEKAHSEIIQSLKFIMSSSQLKQLLALSAVAYLLMGPMQVLLPTVAEQTLNLSETSQGHYLSLVAFSLIIGGVITMLIKSRLHYGVTLISSILIAGVGIGLLGLIEQVTMSVCLLMMAGISAGIAISLIVAGLQLYSPDNYRGRIMSVYTIIGQFIPAISGLSAGVLAGLYQYQNALITFAGLIAVLLTLASWRFSIIRTTKQL